MDEFFNSGRAVDLVLLVMLAEAGWLWRARQVPAAQVMLALLPGVLILLGVRVALTGGPWWAVAGCLAASLPVHIADLARRGWLRRPPQRPPET
ncbi:MAG: hypothetical protein ACK4MX_02215 [Thermaurantiacus sp.]